MDRLRTSPQFCGVLYPNSGYRFKLQKQRCYYQRKRKGVTKCDSVFYGLIFSGYLKYRLGTRDISSDLRTIQNWRVDRLYFEPTSSERTAQICAFRTKLKNAVLRHGKFNRVISLIKPHNGISVDSDSRQSVLIKIFRILCKMCYPCGLKSP